MPIDISILTNVWPVFVDILIDSFEGDSLCYLLSRTRSPLFLLFYRTPSKRSIISIYLVDSGRFFKPPSPIANNFHAFVYMFVLLFIFIIYLFVYYCARSAPVKHNEKMNAVLIEAI